MREARDPEDHQRMGITVEFAHKMSLIDLGLNQMTASPTMAFLCSKWLPYDTLWPHDLQKEDSGHTIYASTSLSEFDSPIRGNGVNPDESRQILPTPGTICFTCWKNRLEKNVQQLTLTREQSDGSPLKALPQSGVPEGKQVYRSKISM